PGDQLPARLADTLADRPGGRSGTDRAAGSTGTTATGGDAMSTNGGRRLVRRVTTVISGGVLLCAAAAAALAGQVWPAEQVPVDATPVPVAATTVGQVCAGPPRLATAVAGEDLGYDE